jgi:hypothetical protein
MPQLRPKRGLHVCLIGLIGFLPSLCWSYEPTLPNATVPYLSSYISQTTANSFVKTIGFSMDHKPFEPATSLGSSFDFGIEATLVKPPSDLGSSIADTLSSYSSGSTTSTPISTSGSTTSTSPIPFVPSIKVHLRKGFGEKVDIGLSTLYVPASLPLAGGTLLLGGDLKYVFYRPEEGVTAAFRASYSYVNLALQYENYILMAKTVTITPQIIVSRKIGFADPYVGMGYQYTYGTIAGTIPAPPVDLLPGVSIAPISLSIDGSGTGVFFFGGVSLLSIIRLRLTLEGAFNPGGENYLGTKIGFTL